MLEKLNGSVCLRVAAASLEDDLGLEGLIDQAVNGLLAHNHYPSEIFIAGAPSKGLPKNTVRTYLLAHIGSANVSIGYVEFTVDDTNYVEFTVDDTNQFKPLTSISCSNSVVEYCLTRANRKVLGAEDISLANAENMLRDALSSFVSVLGDTNPLRNAIQTVYDECKELSRTYHRDPALFTQIIEAMRLLLGDPYQTKQETQAGFKKLVQLENEVFRLQLGGGLLLLIGVAGLICSFTCIPLYSLFMLSALLGASGSFIVGAMLLCTAFMERPAERAVGKVVDVALPLPHQDSFWLKDEKKKVVEEENVNDIVLSQPRS
jgi:hypothetical protein